MVTNEDGELEEEEDEEEDEINLDQEKERFKAMTDSTGWEIGRTIYSTF